MYCNKKKRRTVFDIFTEYSCDGCKYNVFKEVLKIGNSKICFYYRGSCKIKYEKSLIIKRTKLLFKDIIIDSLHNKSNNIFLWLDLHDDLSEIYEDIEGLIECGYNIHIII